MQDRNMIQTFTGLMFDFDDPFDVSLTDIAVALSRIPRFLGHTKKPYSVAEHSIYVSRLLPKHLKIYGLLHDAAEAYIGDMVRTLKKRIPDFSVFEKQIMESICTYFDLSPSCMSDVRIKRADDVMLATEKKQLMRHKIDWGKMEAPCSIQIECWGHKVARARFLKEFYILWR
jgi:hypothetical protein